VQEQPPFSMDSMPDGIPPGDNTDLQAPELSVPEEPEEDDFYENLAEHLEEGELNAIANELIQEVDEDEKSRAEWERVGKIGLTYLGYTISEPKSGSSVQDIQFSTVYDSSLSICWLRFCATARAELLPAAGPCKIDIVGDPTEEIEQKSERVKVFSNHYLTSIDEEYYPDFERLLNYVGIWGSAFKKVYQDPLDNMPKSRFIKPHDIIVNINTTTLLSSDRITHRMELNRRDVEMLEASGEYLPSNLPLVSDDSEDDSQTIRKKIEKMDGVTKGNSENKNQFVYLEVHTDYLADKLDKKFEGRRPYTITICRETKKTVCIKRNWDKQDEKFRRIECFLHYYYLSGFGLYGIGQAHLCGSNSIASTVLLRQSIDLLKFKNLPAGIKKKSASSEDNNVIIMPGEWRNIDTEEPLQDVFMPLPYPNLSPEALQLKTELSQQNLTICGTAESKIPELGATAPVGTTLAVLEVEKQVISTILRSLHTTLKREFKLLFRLFSKYLPDTPYVFSVPGGSSSIMRSDFSDDIHIVPVSDVNALTHIHRLVYAESLLKFAQSYPDIHDLREVFKRLYSAMNVQDIDRILTKPPEPVSIDPLSEVAMVLQNKPLQATFPQDHDAHVMIKNRLLQHPMVQSNMQAYVNLQANIQHHKCYQALNQMMQQKQEEFQQKLAELQQRRAMMPPQESMGLPPSNVFPLRPDPIQLEVQRLLVEKKKSDEELQQLQQMDVMELQKMPEIQNAVAQMDAEKTQQEMEAEQKQMEEQKALQNQQVNPNQVMMNEIAQKREEAKLRDKDAKLRAEVEAFKAQIKYEGEMAKLEAEKKIAEERNENEMEIQRMKQEMERLKMDSQDRLAENKIEIEKMKLGNQPIIQ